MGRESSDSIMSSNTDTIPPSGTAGAGGDNAKREQILAGAERVFLKQGFDAASMDAIARMAGVSKGTLYVYFKNKKDLFKTLILERRRSTAENLLDFQNSSEPPEIVLLDFARRLMDKVVDPKQVSLIRTVVGAVDTFPELGQTFFAAGPEFGAIRLAAYLDGQVARGRLHCDDTREAAWHFMALCFHPTVTGSIYFGLPSPPRAELEQRCQSALRVFLAAYGKPQPPIPA